VLDRFFTYARSHEDVWFARKDEIAKWVLDHREDTPILDRRPSNTRGASGWSSELTVENFRKVIMKVQRLLFGTAAAFRARLGMGVSLPV
jgi:hypothetical protein